jgi:HPt (histidine-containing phosphotransfer) domain-containing protein
MTARVAVQVAPTDALSGAPSGAPSGAAISDAEIIAPSFALQRKVGGPVARLLTPERVKKAEANVETLVPPLKDEVARILRKMEALVASRPAGLRDKVFACAHEIRGLAGTARRQKLGQAAHLLCRYLENTPASFVPDANLLSTITVVATYACVDTADADPMIAMLINDAARAVVVQRRREGRGD